jgi:hypothetical protein
MSQKSKLLKLTTGLFVLTLVFSASHYAQPSGSAAPYPGVFISDTEQRWNTTHQKSDSKHQFGYVICDGGYIGSPLIPNRKSVVDKFLGHCASGQKVGPGLLPIINAPEEVSQQGYKAYQFTLGRQSYNLCRGYLNSTSLCSASSDREALTIAQNIKRKIHQESSVQNPEGPLPLRKLAPAEEAASELANINGNSLQKIRLDAIPLSQANSSKQAVQVTAEEMEALKSGKISLADLTKGKQVINLNNSHSASAASSEVVPNAAPSMSGPSTQKKGLQITASEAEDLKNGRVTLEQLMSNRQLIDLVNQAPQPSQVDSQILNILNQAPQMAQLPAQQPAQPVMSGNALSLNATPLQAIPLSPQAAGALLGGAQISGASMPQAIQPHAMPSPFAANGFAGSPEQAFAQMNGQMSSPGLNPANFAGIGAMPSMDQSAMNGTGMMPPQMLGQMPMQGQDFQPFAADPQMGMQINGPQPEFLPEHGQLNYMDYLQQPTEQGTSVQPLAWSGYYFNQRYFGPPVTFTTNAIYGTHSNTIYWPGMRGAY